MKRLSIITLVLVLLLNLAACDRKGDSAGNTAPIEGNTTEKSNAITAEELIAEMEDAGYEIQPPMSVTMADFGLSIDGSVRDINFYKNEEGVEHFGDVFFFEFDSASDAEAAYAEILDIYYSEGFDFQSVACKNGEKAIFIDDENPDFGTECVLVQVENTLVLAIEGWDIDSSGTYTHELTNILYVLGY